jgi:hypothetical protein
MTKRNILLALILLTACVALSFGPAASADARGRRAGRVVSWTQAPPAYYVDNLPVRYFRAAGPSPPYYYYGDPILNNYPHPSFGYRAVR